MTIKQQGGIFGRNPTFNDVTVDNDLTVNKELTVLDTASIARKSTDGDVLTLKKDSTTVTKFGSVSGVVSYIVLDPRTSSAKGAGFLGSSADASEGIIQGVDGSGATAGGTITLGTLANPFKELYLGGDVHVASGQGIDFSATSGTGTSELLNDYEEGTWTPTYTTDGTDFGSVTYDTQDGHYTKIGNVVVLRAYLRTDAITVGSASGNVVVGGLPFSASNSRNAGSVIPSAFIGDHPIMIQASGSTAYLYYQASASGTTSLLQVADLNTGANDNTIVFTVTYQAS